MSVENQTTDTRIPRALVRYYAGVRTAMRRAAARRAGRDTPAVALDLPEHPSEDFRRFADVTDIGLTEVDPGLHLLDLMRNPGTRTTKSVASLTMVARAVHHIRTTGERLVLLTPTSGNKGTALRDAVARAYASGLATPDELRLVVVVPAASRAKLRGGPLSADPQLRAANPVVVAAVERPAGVKRLATDVLAQVSPWLAGKTGFTCWYTLDLDNYRAADVVRAFVEAELAPITPDSPPRWHAHAVSSGYGLLGYHFGHELLTSREYPEFAEPARHPGFLLVQQLATADMVVSALGREPRPYAPGPGGTWRQEEPADPAFPAVTDDPGEVLDATFYTKNPPTSAEIDPLIARHGGGGIVVSRRECLDRFGEVRSLAANAGIGITADPALIREWSLVKVLTGVLLARERGLVPAGTEIIAHASGYYTDELVPPLDPAHTTPAANAADLAEALTAAVLA
ncbi:DUF6002 family protein [Amycolatopsis sp. PS_44_ISF1]|uniref:DUF6002 family protein n=1 Tax=Amycolatopsis sp. PS_44_ISF1 TaxID=2974917 RepID=UPI0028DE534C|nr:DUF6002 family protein [Amycolatopsis sp. PS_44_ISF1]MDT8914687.1 DUF6002 family protein [Amycolatopsis sp. PS_44_ISF1]